MKEQFAIGDQVRYSPVIGGDTDGREYQITHLDDLHGRSVAWLNGKSGCVSTDALTRIDAANRE